jgi:Uma2 family endonuclease
MTEYEQATHATLEDLSRVKGKAESINGELVVMSPTGFLPGRTGGTIYASLLQYERTTTYIGPMYPKPRRAIGVGR